MEPYNKILQGVGIPYSALLSIIFGMMLLSFPVGAYVIFHTNIGDDINFEFPLISSKELLQGVPLSISIEIGDVFIILWSSYVVLFAIAVLGPKDSFLKSLMPLMTDGRFRYNNYMVAITTWFSILVLVSGVINYVQEGMGILITPPEVENDLLQFYSVSFAPVLEELGFRVLLIGIPAFFLFSPKFSKSVFFKSLWNPSRFIHDDNKLKLLALIVVIGILFGFGHVFSSESWSNGKFTQAAASGIILGWVYLRFGFISSLLVHWATNYFVFSFAYFVAEVNKIPVSEAFYHPLLSTVEVILLSSGVFSATILILNFIFVKKQKLKI